MFSFTVARVLSVWDLRYLCSTQASSTPCNFFPHICICLHMILWLVLFRDIRAPQGLVVLLHMVMYEQCTGIFKLLLETQFAQKLKTSINQKIDHETFI